MTYSMRHDDLLTLQKLKYATRRLMRTSARRFGVGIASGASDPLLIADPGRKTLATFMLRNTFMSRNTLMLSTVSRPTVMSSPVSEESPPRSSFPSRNVDWIERVSLRQSSNASGRKTLRELHADARFNSSRKTTTILEEEAGESSQHTHSSPLEEFLSRLIFSTSEKDIKDLKECGNVTFLAKLDCLSTSSPVAGCLLTYRLTLNDDSDEHAGFIIYPFCCDLDDMAKMNAKFSIDCSKLLISFPRQCPFGVIDTTNGSAQVSSNLIETICGPDRMMPLEIEANLPLETRAGGTISAPTLIYSQSKTQSIVHFKLDKSHHKGLCDFCDLEEVA